MLIFYRKEMLNKIMLFKIFYAYFSFWHYYQVNGPRYKSKAEPVKKVIPE